MIIHDRFNNEKEIPVYSAYNAPLEQLREAYVGGRKAVYAFPCAFDIETTSYSPEISFMYHWQFAVYPNILIFGREWESFVELLNRLHDTIGLSGNAKVMIFVHNLSFEYQFMQNFLKSFGMKVFAIDAREVLYITLENNIEFRCSYKLSNYSLEKFANIYAKTFIKKPEKIDYAKIRYPDTPLTLDELEYNALDVLSLVDAIHEVAKGRGDTMATIPYTSTGYIRRKCRRKCNQSKNYREKFFTPTIFDEDLYVMMRQGSRGGNTHANRKYSDIIIRCQE